jgi:hypothetical protein
MDSTWLEKARDLRQQAYDALQASPAYIAFKTFDDAVVSLGGTPLLSSSEHAEPVKAAATRVFEALVKRSVDGRKMSHGDAAELVLRQHKEPLPIGRLMEAVTKKGVDIGGNDPLNNFRSTVSKDARFRSCKRNNTYFWWLTNDPLPPTWNEAADPDLLTESAVSSEPSSEKGGDGDAPATT